MCDHNGSVMWLMHVLSLWIHEQDSDIDSHLMMNTIDVGHIPHPSLVVASAGNPNSCCIIIIISPPPNILFSVSCLSQIFTHISKFVRNGACGVYKSVGVT